MVAFIIRCLLFALSFVLAAKVVPGLHVRSFKSAVLFAAVFAILDFFLFKLLAILTLPLVIVSLGLFLLVIRAGLFMLTDKFIDGVHIEGFVPALLGSITTGVLNWLINWVVTRFISLD